MTDVSKLLSALGAAVLLSGPAFANDHAEKKEDPLAGWERTGDTRTCLNLRQIDRMNYIGDGLILVETLSKTYVTDAGKGCRGERRGDAFKYDVYGSQLCRGEIVQTIDTQTGMFTGSCSLGDFELLEKKKREGADTAS